MQKEIVNQVQEAQRISCILYRINQRRNTPRHILIKLTKSKHKERILKVARVKQHVPYKGNPIHLRADISAETAGQKGMVGYKVLKGKNLQPRLLYPARISFKIDGEIKTFSDKQKLREFSTKTSFATNVKWTYVVRKYTRRKRSTKTNFKQLRKWQ